MSTRRLAVRLEACLIMQHRWLQLPNLPKLRSFSRYTSFCPLSTVADQGAELAFYPFPYLQSYRLWQLRHQTGHCDVLTHKDASSAVKLAYYDLLDETVAAGLPMVIFRPVFVLPRKGPWQWRRLSHVGSGLGRMRHCLIYRHRPEWVDFEACIGPM